MILKMSVTDQAFVTLATNDVYCYGALVLGQSLRNHRTTRRLAILITPQVSCTMRTALSNIFDAVVDVNEIDSSDTVHLALMKRLELGITFTKLHCWTLTQYTKCVFMDADTMVLCNIDDLFDREELSAAPDPGWPDCFNSGVFVFQPSLETFNLLLQFAKETGSFDEILHRGAEKEPPRRVVFLDHNRAYPGGDQGLLNSFFSNWATKDIKKHLPFLYNLTSSAIYTYAPAFEHFGKDAKVVHFLGRVKPWDYKFSPQTNTVLDDSPSSVSESQLSFLELWWMTYTSSILPLLGKLQESEIPREELILSGDDGNTFEAGNPFGSSFLPISGDLAHVSKLVRNSSSEKSVKNDYFPSHVSYLSIKPRADKMSTAEERRKWEEGHVDYLGKDAFENIKKKLDSFLL